jgi:integrase
MASTAEKAHAPASIAREADAWAKRDRTLYKGVHRVKAKLASGKVAYYYYAWRGGPMFAGDATDTSFPSKKADVALTRIKERRWEYGKRASTSKTVTDLITGYRLANSVPKKLRPFAELSASTRYQYDLAFGRIRAKFGTLPIGAVTVKTAAKLRAKLVVWHDDLIKAHGANTGDQTMKAFGLVFEYAIYAGEATVNPVKDIAMRYDGGHRPDKLWDEDVELHFYREARGYLAHALFLACWTGQRQGDLVAMRFGRGKPGQPYYDPETGWVHLTQEKTRELVTFPAASVLRDKLNAEWARRQAAGITETRILLTSERKPWASKMSFRGKFNLKKNELAGGAFADLHFHDARGTAATRLHVFGKVPIPLVAAITGHKETSIKTLVERYLGGRPNEAARAMELAEGSELFQALQARVGKVFSFEAAA